VTVHDHLDEAERLLGGVLRDRPGDPAAASALAWWWDTRWELHEQLLAPAKDDFDGYFPDIEDAGAVLAERGVAIARAAVAAAPLNDLCHTVLSTALQARGEESPTRTSCGGPATVCLPTRTRRRR